MLHGSSANRELHLRAMPSALRAALLVCVTAALTVGRPGKTGRAERGQSSPLYGWAPGDEFGRGGPEQTSGAHSFAIDVPSPIRRPTSAKQVSYPAAPDSGNRELRTTQEMLLGRKSKHSSRFPIYLQARMLLPRAKLAFCYLPKVASSQMARLFGELNSAQGENWMMTPWEFSSPSRLNISWDDVTKENGWKFAFLHRDPLARYLSAFGSKCMENANKGIVEGAGKDCLGKILWTEVPLETMIETFEERAQNDSLKGQLANNSHWLPMVMGLRACGMDRFHPSVVDFSGDIGEDATAQVRRMFEVTGVMQAYPNASVLVDKYFPPLAVSGHWSKSHDKLTDFYRNMSTVQAVAKLYDEDYQRLELQLPGEIVSMFATARPQADH